MSSTLTSVSLRRPTLNNSRPCFEVGSLRLDQTLTSVDHKDPWFSAMTSAFKKHNLNVRPQIFPAGTDSRYLREVGIPAIGFSPMPNTPVLLHDHNEFLNEEIFLRGIDVFVDIIESVSNVDFV